MASRTQDATKTMQEILQRYAALSQQGEKLRQVLVAKGTVPCAVWGAYNEACLDYLKKSQAVFDQLTQKGIAVDQIVYSAGQPVADPNVSGAYKTLRVNAPLRPPAFGFTAASCPGIPTFQGIDLEGTAGWSPIPLELGSLPATMFTAIGTGMIMVLTAGAAPIGAAAYGSYKTYQTVSVWIEDYFDPPVRILQAFTDCFVKSVQNGLSAERASAQCSAAQTSAQQYAKDKAAADSWGFWSWVGVGTAVLVVGGALALYLRGRIAGVAGIARMGGADDDDGLHARIAAALGWSVRDVHSMSLASLRDLVRPVSPKLASEISSTIARGGHVLGGFAGPVVAKLYAGYRLIHANGTTWKVLGGRSLRGVYRYVLRREHDGAKVSMLRSDVLQNQRDGLLTVQGA
jgi:hypothetical protein